MTTHRIPACLKVFTMHFTQEKIELSINEFLNVKTGT